MACHNETCTTHDDHRPGNDPCGRKASFLLADTDGSVACEIFDCETQWGGGGTVFKPFFRILGDAKVASAQLTADLFDLELNCN